MIAERQCGLKNEEPQRFFLIILYLASVSSVSSVAGVLGNRFLYA